MIVFRVECKKHHRGIFWGCNEQCPWVDIETNWRRHPTPQSEDYRMDESEICGVANFRDLVTWFSTKAIRDELHRCGWVIGVYEAPEFHQLSNQVCFTKDKATRIDEIPLGVNTLQWVC